MTENSAAPPPDGAKGARIKTVLVGFLGLAVVADIAFRAASYFRHAPASQAGEGTAQPADTERHGEQEAAPVAKKIDAKSTMKLDAFLVNLADKDAARFLKVQFGIGLDDERLGEELAGQSVTLAAVRDAIISVLSAKTSEEVITPEGKERLRAEIKERVGAVLPKGKVTDVYIMDFVVQL